jgi:NAD(P)-dependent dehydrogenase (short-subunit alcohol dehydrogenase family)
MQFATFHDLEDQSIFITGGGSGIGADLTKGFLSQGAKVTFIQRSNPEKFLIDAM